MMDIQMTIKANRLLFVECLTYLHLKTDDGLVLSVVRMKNLNLVVYDLFKVSQLGKLTKITRD